MVNFCKRHTVVIIIGITVVIAAFVIVSEWSRRQKLSSVSQTSEEYVGIVESEANPVVESREEPKAPPPVATKEQPQQAQTAQGSSTPKAGQTESRTRRREELSQAIKDLQQKLKEIQGRIVELQKEESQRKKTRVQILQMLENHANEIENLGNTLRQVFKTSTQIRIIATDLKNQAEGLRTQIHSEAQTVGSSSIEREIWTVKKAVMEQRAADLDALALDLQRTGGEPAKVRIIAIRIQEKAGVIRRNIESKKSEKIEPDPELLTLERQQKTLQNRIQEMQEQHREMVPQ